MSDTNETEQSNDPSQGLYLFSFLFCFFAMVYIMLTRGNFLF